MKPSQNVVETSRAITHADGMRRVVPKALFILMGWWYCLPGGTMSGSSLVVAEEPDRQEDRRRRCCNRLRGGLGRTTSGAVSDSSDARYRGWFVAQPWSERSSAPGRFGTFWPSARLCVECVPVILSEVERRSGWPRCSRRPTPTRHVDSTGVPRWAWRVRIGRRRVGVKEEGTCGS